MKVLQFVLLTCLWSTRALPDPTDNMCTTSCLYFVLNNGTYCKCETLFWVNESEILPCIYSNISTDCCSDLDYQESINISAAIVEWDYLNDTEILHKSCQVMSTVTDGDQQVLMLLANLNLSVPLGDYTCEIVFYDSEYYFTANICIYSESETTSSIPENSTSSSQSTTSTTSVETSHTSPHTTTNKSEFKLTDILASYKTVIGACAGGMLALLILVIMIILITKRKRTPRKKQIEETSMAIIISDHEHSDIITEPPLSSLTPQGDTSNKSYQPIPVEQFSAHVASMQADGNNTFDQEYSTIGLSDEPDSSVSKQSRNFKRNRFANIYPYDFNRVILKSLPEVENSDYINASYINGYGRNKVYIAAQGPKPETVEDFWRMIWEYSIPTIAMLTRVFEGKKKCEKYWPDNVGEVLVPLGNNNFSVKLNSLLPFAEYVLRNMTVSKDNETGFDVTMFHYLAWPDHGVPANAMSMINFIKRVRKIHPYHKEDLVLVHCSAGVGRTGTFITLDYMLERIKKEKNINIHEFVDNLRKQRVQMVQTLTQYTFIYKALDEFRTCGDTEIQSIDLRIVINKLGRNIKSENTSGFTQQYEILNAMTKKLEGAAASSDATNPTNQALNRFEDKLPFNKTRVRLHPYDSHHSDYINASFVGGYRNTGSYIATQGPLPQTVGSFWRMVWEQQVKCIVMLCKVVEKDKEVCHCYWPKKQGTNEVYDYVNVTMTAQETTSDYIIRKLHISKHELESPNSDQGFSVTQFQFLKWPEDSVPQVTSSILEMANLVQKVQISTGNKAIVVMCNDGVGRTGCFLTTHAQMERMKAEGVVDFFQFIKSVRFQRPGLVSNKVQYEFCHRALADFLDGFDAYANFKKII